MSEGDKIPEHYLLEEVAKRPERLITGIGREGREIELTAGQWEYLHFIDRWTEDIVKDLESDHAKAHEITEYQKNVKKLEREPRRA